MCDVRFNRRRTHNDRPCKGDGTKPCLHLSVTQAVCDLALRFGESIHDEEAMMSRPFGVALLIAGIDELGPQLYALSQGFGSY